MKTFKTYKDAYNYAVAEALPTLDCGIEKKKEFGKEIFLVSYLPKKQNTFGHEMLKQRVTFGEPPMA